MATFFWWAIVIVFGFLGVAALIYAGMLYFADDADELKRR